VESVSESSLNSFLNPSCNRSLNGADHCHVGCLLALFKKNLKNNNNNNQFFDDQVTYESIHGALNAAPADHHCGARKKPVLAWYTLAASTLIILCVEMLKLSPKNKFE